MQQMCYAKHLRGGYHPIVSRRVNVASRFASCLSSETKLGRVRMHVIFQQTTIGRLQDLYELRM